MNTYFDIETGPLPNEQLAKVMPTFTAPSNYKDLSKIETYIADAARAWMDRAALSALTGRVLAIGVMRGPDIRIIGVESESEMLAMFWNHWRDERLGSAYVGFCTKTFDLPFMFQRSVILQVPVPMNLFDGRYWNSRFIDLQERWLCFGRNSEGASLDSVCRACGLGQKTGKGVDFAGLWESNRDAAISYLKQDLRLAAALAERLGV